MRRSVPPAPQQAQQQQQLPLRPPGRALAVFVRLRVVLLLLLLIMVIVMLHSTLPAVLLSVEVVVAANREPAPGRGFRHRPSSKGREERLSRSGAALRRGGVQGGAQHRQ